MKIIKCAYPIGLQHLWRNVGYLTFDIEFLLITCSAIKAMILFVAIYLSR